MKLQIFYNRANQMVSLKFGEYLMHFISIALAIFSIDRARLSTFKTLDELYFVYGLQYIKRLADILGDDDADENDRIAAAKEIERQFTSPWKAVEKMKREKWTTGESKLKVEITTAVSLIFRNYESIIIIIYITIIIPFLVVESVGEF